jgi:glycosyltransferase involved in cell wall biosynthesis
VVAYGPHVAAHARSRGARRVLTAPQAVDQAFWATPGAPRAPGPVTFLWVGRDAPAKGLAELLAAWDAAGLRDARLELVGVERDVAEHPGSPPIPPPTRRRYATSTPPRTFS